MEKQWENGIRKIGLVKWIKGICKHCKDQNGDPVRIATNLKRYQTNGCSNCGVFDPF